MGLRSVDRVVGELGRRLGWTLGFLFWEEAGGGPLKILGIPPGFSMGRSKLLLGGPLPLELLILSGLPGIDIK